MDQSILTNIKKLLGIPEEYEHFDADLIMHINGVLMTLTQIGVGDPNGFMISDKSATWKDFIGAEENHALVASIYSYVYMKVKLMFDPPQNSFAIESLNKLIAECEWRINVNVDNQTQNPIT